MVVFGQTAVSNCTVTITVLEEVDWTLLLVLVEALPARRKQDDESDRDCADDTTNHTTHNRANVGVGAVGE